MKPAAALLLVPLVFAIAALQRVEAQASAPPRAFLSRETPHLTVRGTAPSTPIEPGARFSIVFDVSPKTGMHIYAPGSQYRAVAVALQPHALVRVHDPVYPKATPYLFKPLNEEVPVYAMPFRLVVDVTPGETAAQRSELRGRGRVTITGTFEYQACDDRVCYFPASIPFEWTMRLTR